MFDVLILGGAPNDGELRNMSSQEYEALIDIQGKPMVEYVLKAVKASKYTEKIALVGPVEAFRSLLTTEPDVYVESGTTLLENMQKGLQPLRKNRLTLFMTADIPLISPEAIDDFLEKAMAQEGEVFYPVISKEICERAFPDMQRTYVRLKEGVFTGGNIFILHPDVLVHCHDSLESMFGHRKSPWKLSRILGPAFLLRFALGQLSIQQIESKVFRSFGCRGVAIFSEYVEMAVDVDKVVDLELVRAHLQTQGRAMP